MFLMVDCSGSCSEEVLTELEFGLPPNFEDVEAAIQWAEENFPMGVAFEVYGQGNRIWYQGYVKARGGLVRRGVHRKYSILEDGRAYEKSQRCSPS